jgi:glycosyltransferase involved in cell wall biosynthesis
MAMKLKKSILFFHAGAELYGADKILCILASGLVERGWTVLVVLPWDGELRVPLETAGVKVIVLNHGVLRRKYFTPCGLINRAYKIVLASRTLVHIAREHDVALVHTNTSVVMAGALTAKLMNVPHVWHIHEITTRPRAVWRTLSWLIPRLADRVVCVSSAVLSHMTLGNRANAEKGIVLYNGIEPMKAAVGAREQFRDEIAAAPGDVVIGMVGRVNKWKGQMAFAEAAELVISRCPNVKFVFVGGTFAGEEHLMTALRERVSKGVLAGKVTVLAFHKDVAEIMAALDIFVLPSTQPDPLPTVVLEAMSVGCPVVAFAHGGVCEMTIHGKTGLLVSPCDINALGSAVEELVTDGEKRRRFGIAGKQRFNGSFSVIGFLNEFEDVYKKAIDH